jgi:hypothetical protein
MAILEQSFEDRLFLNECSPGGVLEVKRVIWCPCSHLRMAFRALAAVVFCCVACSSARSCRSVLQISCDLALI